jgi:hypothetical protein
MKLTEQHIRGAIRLHWIAVSATAIVSSVLMDAWPTWELIPCSVFLIMLSYVAYSRLILPIEGFLASKIASVLKRIPR